MHSHALTKRVGQTLPPYSCAVALGVLASLTPPLIHAQAETKQAAGPGLEEVVVTAQRRSENLQRVPISVTAVTSEQLLDAGVVATADLPTIVAGLNFQSTFLFFQPHLRGIGTSFYGPGVENPVALYVDDVYYGSQLMAPSDLSNVSQVAVLKGPQGTLFGRNSTGGVIQMTTRQPESALQGEFRTDLDNYLTSRSYAYVTGGSDAVRANLGLTYATQNDAWGKNVFTGEDDRKTTRDLSARSTLAWDLSEDTFVKVSGDYGTRKSGIGLNMRIIPGTSGVLLGSEVNSSNPYDFALTTSSQGTFEGGGGSVNIEHNFGPAKLVSITSYRQLNFHQGADVDGSTAFVYFVERGQHSEQYTQELRLASSADARLNWVFGAYYFHSRDANTPFGLYLNDGSAEAGTDLGNQSFVPGTLTLLQNKLAMTTDSISGFGQSTLQLADTSRLTAGLRYTNENRTQKGPSALYFDGFQIGPSTLFDRKFDESAWTWRLALDHDFAEGTMGYLSYNRGFKSGGFNANSGLQPPYKKETVNTYEIGMKSEFLDRRVRLNAAAFYNDYKDIQVQEFTGTVTIAANAPGAETYGVDLEAEWQASEALSFALTSEWLHATYTSYPGAPTTRPLAGGGLEQIAADASGKRLSLAPTFTLNASVNYDWHVGESTLGLNLTNSYNNGYFTEPDNVLRQDAFSLLNASLTWTAPGERLSVSAWGRNLLDELVPTFLASNAPNGYVADYTNPPLTYGISARYLFGAR